jgi:endonuclease III
MVARNAPGASAPPTAISAPTATRARPSPSAHAPATVRGRAATPARPPAALRKRALAINTILAEHYGPLAPRSNIDPLSELVAVVLSQHTSDVNSERAFESLRARYPDWESVRTAPTADVANAIRSGGLAIIKAVRIQRILNQILEARGELDLGFLADLSLDEGRAFLRALDGVGPKSAACVLLFSLNKPAMPVDTHVHRVAGRLGLIPAGTSADAAHEQLERLVPPELVYAFHVHLIRHGRVTCKAPRPRCAQCPVIALCPYPAKTV